MSFGYKVLGFGSGGRGAVKELTADYLIVSGGGGGGGNPNAGAAGGGGGEQKKSVGAIASEMKQGIGEAKGMMAEGKALWGGIKDLWEDEGTNMMMLLISSLLQEGMEG